jgi:hypothetical protein
MLNEQLDLDSPYDANPYNDPDMERVINSEDPMLVKERPDETGNRCSIQRRKSRWTKFQATILNRGYVPLVLRLISWIFSIAALFLAGFITRFSILAGVETRPSTVMAFVVNGIAIFYLPWVAKVFTG